MTQEVSGAHSASVDCNDGGITEEETSAYMASGWRAKTESEAEWQKEGHGISWVDLQPYWVSACDWSLWLDCPWHECTRVIRFVLIGGGQIKVQERFYVDSRTNRIVNDWTYGSRLTVKAETADGIAIVKGKLATALAEMVCMDAVLMAPRQQAIAERTADTLRLIDCDANNFAALLDGSEGCAFCERRLGDHISKLLGYGPICAQNYGLPHTLEAANAKLAKRRALLAKGGSL
jgi:Family of unknown function (DUF6011)